MTEKNAKWPSPPVARISGLMTTCSIAMPSPITNSPTNDDRVDGIERDGQATEQIQARRRPAVSYECAARLDQCAGRNRDQPVSEEERERQKTGQPEAQVEVADDDGHQRADQVGHERDDEPHDHDVTDDEGADFHYTTGTWLTLFFGSIQNDSFTKRAKISRGRMGVRSIGSTFGRTVCRPGMPMRASNSSAL